MNRWAGKVAVVTGASSGIGAAIAYQLQDAGVNVVALACRKELIEQALADARKQAAARGRSESIGKCSTPGKLYPLKCDVSDENDILDAFTWVKRNLGGVDILINNAGIGEVFDLSDVSTIKMKTLIDTNVAGLSKCTREAVQQMKYRKVDGHIVYISSIAGNTQPSVGWAVYSASKLAVRVLIEGLRKGLVAEKSKIKTTCVSPGEVKIDILPRVNSKYENFLTGQNLRSEDVADAVLYALSTPPHVQIHDIIIKPVEEEI